MLHGLLHGMPWNRRSINADWMLTWVWYNLTLSFIAMLLSRCHLIDYPNSGRWLIAFGLCYILHIPIFHVYFHNFIPNSWTISLSRFIHIRSFEVVRQLNIPMFTFHLTQTVLRIQLPYERMYSQYYRRAQRAHHCYLLLSVLINHWLMWTVDLDQI